jgi:RNA polymerase-binding transcription factor DksA
MTNENMPDPIDRASAEADAANEEALREHAKRAAGDMPKPTESGECIDCAEPVEPQRLAIGLGRCLQCQKDYEAARTRRSVRGY